MQRLRMYTTCYLSCYVVIQPYAKIWYDYVRERRRSFQTQIHGENINFDIEVKGQGHTEVINVRYTLYHGNHSRAKHSMNMSKEKKLARTQSHVINPINLTLSSKDNVLSGS